MHIGRTIVFATVGVVLSATLGAGLAYAALRPQLTELRAGQSDRERDVNTLIQRLDEVTADLKTAEASLHSLQTTPDNFVRIDGSSRYSSLDLSALSQCLSDVEDAIEEFEEITQYGFGFLPSVQCYGVVGR